MTDEPLVPKNVLDALIELFAGPTIRTSKFFRYPIDGPNDVQAAVDAAFREVLGPDEEYERWVCRLRQFRLIGTPDKDVSE